MEKIKIIIPEDFLNQLDGFEIVKSEEICTQDSGLKLDLSELISPNFIILLSIIAIPSSIEGIHSLVERIKRYFYRKKEDSIIIIMRGKRFVLNESTSEQTYKELVKYYNWVNGDEEN